MRFQKMIIIGTLLIQFLFYRTQVYLARFATNASGTTWWPNLEQMQMVPPGGQLCNQCDQCEVSNASGATWQPNLHPILFAKFAYEITQVMDLIPGSVVPLAMFLLILTSSRVITNLNKFYQSIYIFASGLELKHWKEMVENPRRPIVHWHVLKVKAQTIKMICIFQF